MSPFVLAFAMLFSAQRASAQITIYTREAPQAHQNAAAPGAAATATSPMTREPAVTVPLDNTGIADWSYLNPRRPATIPATADLEFDNQTDDRTFEVTTTLAFKPGDLTPRATAATVPLLIYEALAPGSIAAAAASGSIEAIEAALYSQLISQGNTQAYRDAISHIARLEDALRRRAAKREVEAAARKAVAALSRTSTVADFDAARQAVIAAENDRLASDQEIAVLTGTATPGDALDDLPATRKPVIDALKLRGQQLRTTRAQMPPNTRAAISEEIALVDAAINAAETHSDETAFFAPFRLAVPGAFLEDCTIAAGAATCTAAVRVYPRGRATFPHQVLLLQADGAAVARFNVRFFQEEETPARQLAYVVSAMRVASIAPPKTAATLMAVASVGASLDPFIADRSAVSRNCPFLCINTPYTGDRRTHYTGTGRVEVTQTFGNLLDGKVTLAYKEGDLGGAAANTTVKLSQYRFNIYSVPGVTFHFGKFQFAAPSGGIAINETGEGFRLAFRNLAGSHITKRESSANTSDSANRDSEVTILEAVNMPLPKALRLNYPNQPIRTISLTYALGNDRKGPEEKAHPGTGLKETFFTEHDYTTYGGQVGFTAPRSFYGTFAAYRSKREADEADAPCNQALHVCDGRGDVALLTVTKPFAVDEDGKAERTFTLSAAMGSGDDPDTTTDDEGFIGETAGFAPDFIFLSGLAGGLSAREFFDVKTFADPADKDHDTVLKQEFMAKDLGVLGIGRGLANKRYLGLKYVENRVSPLAWIATRFFRIPAADVRSKAMIVTAHDYHLRRAVFGDSRDAGRELDVEFNVETPRSVKVIVKFGYYWRGEAVKQVIQKNVWHASGSVSISL